MCTDFPARAAQRGFSLSQGAFGTGADRHISACKGECLGYGQAYTSATASDQGTFTG
jgi:hypothetical protein